MLPMALTMDMSTFIRMRVGKYDTTLQKTGRLPGASSSMRYGDTANRDVIIIIACF